MYQKKIRKMRKVPTRQCKFTGLTRYANVSVYITTFTYVVSPSYFFDIRSLIGDQFTHLFIKKEFNTSLITSFI